MGIVLKNKYINIHLPSSIIIGVMGREYDNFLNSIDSNIVSIIHKEDYFYTNSVYSEIYNNYHGNNFDKDKSILFKEFNLDDNFMYKRISDLSNSERCILKYILAFIDNKKIIIIDDGMLDLDYNNKRKIIVLLKQIVRNTDKIILYGSNDSDLIFSLCKKILLVNRRKYVFLNSLDVFTNEDILNEFSISCPYLVEFVNLVKKKKVLINYSNDIRDLIKDVYKSV